MIKIYSVMHEEEQGLSPLLTKYDDQISILSAYRSFEEATSALKNVTSQWSDARKYKVVELEQDHMQTLGKIESRLRIRVVVHVS